MQKGAVPPIDRIQTPSTRIKMEAYRCARKRCYVHGRMLMCMDLDQIKMCSNKSTFDRLIVANNILDCLTVVA